MPQAKSSREDTVVKGVKKVLKRPDIFSWKTHGGGYGTVAGLPDFSVCRRGRFIGIEVKRPSGTHPLTDKQRVILWKIVDAGGIAVVVNDPQQVVSLFEKLDGPQLRDMGTFWKRVIDFRDPLLHTVPRIEAPTPTGPGE